ncbi:MAG: hypothetical protein WC107_05270 [Patescibacteria group bacterium]
MGILEDALIQAGFQPSQESVELTVCKICKKPRDPSNHMEVCDNCFAVGYMVWTIKERLSSGEVVCLIHGGRRCILLNDEYICPECSPHLCGNDQYELGDADLFTAG